MQSSNRLMLRALRSVLLVMTFTIATLYFNRRGFYPPHGHPFIYAISMSWLIAFSVAMLTAIFKMNPKLFSLFRWEKDGKVYDHTGIRAFRWVLLKSPLGWINGNYHVVASRTAFERLLRETNVTEWVHWLSLFLSIILAISCFVDGYAVYGYVLLLIRIPFDIYPIMLQRWNRVRVCRALTRQLRMSGGEDVCP
jgi:hypothetical protein